MRSSLLHAAVVCLACACGQSTSNGSHGAGGGSTSSAGAGGGSTSNAGAGGGSNIAGSGGAPAVGAVLAPTGAATASGPVDGISCDSSESLLFHIHAHIAVYVAGELRPLPAGIGIGPPLAIQGGFVVGGGCFSWLHTHDETGVVHIESPVQRTYTTGDFFDVWGQPLSSNQVGPDVGAVTATVDGAPFAGDPRTIPLNAHALVQLDVGAPIVPPQPYTFAAGL